MKCPIKAATIVKSNTLNRVNVVINEDAADILGIDDLEVIFLNLGNAVDFVKRMQDDLDQSYADAC